MGAFFPLRRTFSILVVIALPVLLVMLALVAAEYMELFPAIVGFLIILFLNLLLLVPFLRDLHSLTEYAKEIEQAEIDPLPPALQNTLLKDLCIGLRQIHRARRSVRKELVAKIGFYQNLFDGLPLPLFLLDQKRRIVGENLAAREIFGHHPLTCDLGVVLRHPDLLESVDMVIINGFSKRDITFALPAQQEVQYRATIVALEQATGDGTAAVLILHDITALKRVEQMRADFVANASHELRTPLASISGFIETLRGPAKDDEEARNNFLAIMYDQTTRMSRLVTDLLTLSRIELLEHTRPDGRVDIAALLTRLAAECDHRAAEKGMKIELDLSANLPAAAGQENELEQVFNNLIDNALKYGRENSVVTVALSLVSTLPISMSGQHERALLASVSDRGEGIAHEHLPRLTERFFRVDSARSRQMGGTGLGLAIVKHVVNRHRGALVIESELGEGSRFLIYLPIVVPSGDV